METSPTLQPVLVGQGGTLNGHRWEISSELSIGRSDVNQIVVSDHRVSRKHAVVQLTDSQVILTDLTSKNGTFLNGKPVTESVTLTDGDLIQIALAQKFIYLGQDATIPLGPSDFEKSVISYFRRLRVDQGAYRVWIQNKEVEPPLSSLQFNFLACLTAAEGKVVSRQEIIEYVWSTQESIGVTDQALDALVRRLRDRLSEAYPDHEFIITVRGQVFRLDNPPFKPSI